MATPHDAAVQHLRHRHVSLADIENLAVDIALACESDDIGDLLYSAAFPAAGHSAVAPLDERIAV